MQHAFFVADDDVRCAQFQQALQTIITVDHATIQIVQIRRGETTAVQWNQWTQIRRQHWQYSQHHPLWTVARFQEGFNQLDTLGQTLQLGFRIGRCDFFFQTDQFRLQIDRAQQVMHGFGTHQGIEIFAVFLTCRHELFFGQQLAALECRQTWLDHHEGFEIQDAFDVTQGHIQHQTDTRWQRFEEPDVGGRRSQFDMAHAFATDFRQRHFGTAFFADDAAVFHALVFTTQAFVILDRTENGGAEQAVALRLEGTIVDGFRFFDFTERPRADQVRRSQTNLDTVKIQRLTLLVEQV